MKKFLVGMTLVIGLTEAHSVSAGNEQKRGQAGATELTVNPWARSSGWAGANSAGIRGVESINSNIGGLAYVQGTEILFASTNWLRGTDIGINAFGIGQQLGKNGGVLGFSAVAWDLGKLYQTTYFDPDQSLVFRMSIINLGLSYSKVFSNSITGGLTVRYLSESVPNASASGVSVDGGVQYQTHIGKGTDTDRKNFKVGVALRNVGPEMQYSGDGLTSRAAIQGLNISDAAVQGRADTYEIPSSLSIGVMYDVALAEDHRLSVAGNFISNTFSHDQIQGGLEYAFMERFMVRSGYDYIKGNYTAETRTSAHTGLTAGVSVAVPFGVEKNHSFGVDYAYRHSNPFNGTHSVGIRLTL